MLTDDKLNVSVVEDQLNRMEQILDSKTRVTILMSVFNGEKTIRESIESILSQNFQNFIFVVYDDASTDKTRTILESFKDPRLKAIYLPENRGLAYNLAEGVEATVTEFIARMDADDIALPERIGAQISFLDENPEVDVVGTNVIFFDNTGRESIGIQPRDHLDISLTLFFGFTMMHPTIMLRTSAMKRHNFNYNPEYNYSEDFDLWDRMIFVSKFANIQIPLLKLREHASKITKSKSDLVGQATARIRHRQLKRVLNEFSFYDYDLFCRAADGCLIDSRKDLEALHSFLVSLIEKNDEKDVYDKAAFSRYAAKFFQGKCRQTLKSGLPAGGVYLFSQLRKYNTQVSLREELGFFVLLSAALIRIVIISFPGRTSNT